MSQGAGVMHDSVELRLATSLEQAFAPVGDEEWPPIAEAKRAVPLLWLSLFDYEEAQVRFAGGREVFAAAAPVAVAAQRAAAMEQILPEAPEALRAGAAALARALRVTANDHLVTLFPEGVFRGLPPQPARAYLKQLFQLCDAWQKLREGTPWSEAEPVLNSVSADAFRQLPEQDPHVATFYLVGRVTAAGDPLDAYLIREGQEKDDLEPEALALGEAGLLLGRFDGTWKLMASESSADLRAAWGMDGTIYLTGREGTVVRLRKGRCKPMPLESRAALHAVWGLDPKIVLAAGDRGLLLAFNGTAWQQVPLRTDAALRSIAGTRPDDIYVGGDEAGVFRFDGHGWSHVAAPEGGMVSKLAAVDGHLLGIGGSHRGGELYQLTRSGWTRDRSLPRMDWVTDLWSGWDSEVGVVEASGAAFVRGPTGWTRETLPLEGVTAVAAGSSVMAVGASGRHQVICRRTESGWCVEATVVGLRLHAIWVGGRPKPPRAPLPPRDQDQGDVPGEGSHHA